MSDSTFNQLSDIIELYEINEFLDDEQAEKGLLKLASILAKSEINPNNVARHIVECEALSVAYGLKAKYYMLLGKDDVGAREKKNLYMSLKDGFHELAASLKYLIRST